MNLKWNSLVSTSSVDFNEDIKNQIFYSDEVNWFASKIWTLAILCQTQLLLEHSKKIDLRLYEPSTQELDYLNKLEEFLFGKPHEGDLLHEILDSGFTRKFLKVIPEMASWFTDIHKANRLIRDKNLNIRFSTNELYLMRGNPDFKKNFDKYITDLVLNSNVYIESTSLFGVSTFIKNKDLV